MARQVKWKYGRLNAVQKSKFSRRLETNSKNSLLNSREAARDVLYNQKLDIHGEFTGVVLKQIPSDKNIDSESALTRIANFFGDSDDIPPQIAVKIRVPEVHSMIPEPEDIDDNINIALHDTFHAAVSDVGAVLEWGTIVVVSFYDSSGIYSPKIKRILPSGDNRSFMPKSSPKPRSESQTVEETNVIACTGDTIGSGKKGGCQTSGNPAEDSPSEHPVPKNHVGKTIVEILPSEVFRENRVRVHEGITSIPSNSSLLVNVDVRPTFPSSRAKLHTLVAARFNALKAAASQENIIIYCQSGWRAHEYKSREDYEHKMVTTYGSVSKGALEKAYISAHETGLAVDFYIPASNESEVDVAPSQPGDRKYGSRTNSLQKKTKAFKWLKENAHKYGFTPYNKEAWHWEVLLPIEAWKTGSEITDQFDITNYDVRVRETSIANGKKTTNRNFTFE